MLQILLNNRKLELPEDISISYEIQNPLITTDRIPIPFTQNFSVPASPGNLMALGNPSRISANVNFENKVPGEIRHSGFIISSGVFTIEEVNDKEITLNFQGAVFPDSIKKQLQNQKLGNEPLGELEVIQSHRPGFSYVSDNKAIAAFNSLMSNKAKQAYPDYVAAPIRIREGEIDSEKMDSGNGNYSGVFWDNSTFINTYRPADGVGRYDQYILTVTPRGGRKLITKIMPSFRVGFIIEKIINQPIEKNRFNNDLQNLYLICNYAQSYQIENPKPVWSVQNLNVSIDLSDYMPDIPANDFISEILKIPCATMFVLSGRYIIELNSDILRAPCTIDWSNRIEDGYSIRRQEAEDYLFSINSESSSSIDEGVDILQVNTIDQMIANMDSLTLSESESDNAVYYKVTSTNQVYKVAPNPILSTEDATHWSCELVSQGEQPESAESDRVSFDMNINGSVVSTTVSEYVGANMNYVPDIIDGKSNHIRYFCPEIDINTQKPERTSGLVFGLYHGMRSTPKTSSGAKFDYPLMSHTNILSDGMVTASVALTTDYLMERYHYYFRQWVEKDKQIVKGEIRLTPIEIHRFDIREKVHFKGADFLVDSINIPLRLHEIAPVKIELIEA